MTKEKINSLIKSPFFILSFLYTIIFFISGFCKWLEVLLIPIMIVGFIIFDIEHDFYFFIYTQAFYMSQLLVRPAIVTEVIFIIVLTIKFFKTRKEKNYETHKNLLILISIFTAYTVLISLFHKMAIYSFSYVFYLPFFYIIFVTRKEYSLTKSIRYLSYSLIISSLLALISIFLPFYELETIRHVNNTIRFRGYFGSPNTLYMFAILALTGILYLYFSKKIKLLEMFTNLVLLSVITLATLSKSGIVILALIIFIGIILYLKEDFKKRIYHILAFLLLFIIALFIFKDLALTIIGRFFTKFDSNIINSLFTGRIDIWKAYCNLIFSSPLNFLYGCGIFSKYAYVPAMGRDRAHHNLYIFLLHKFGIIGIVLLILIIREFIVSAKKQKPRFINYLPLIYFLIEGFCDNAFMQPLFYIIIAFVMFNNNESKVQKESNNTES